MRTPFAIHLFITKSNLLAGPLYKLCAIAWCIHCTLVCMPMVFSVFTLRSCVMCSVYVCYVVGRVLYVAREIVVNSIRVFT